MLVQKRTEQTGVNSEIFGLVKTVNAQRGEAGAEPRNYYGLCS